MNKETLKLIRKYEPYKKSLTLVHLNINDIIYTAATNNKAFIRFVWGQI